MSVTIQLRRGTEQQWQTANPLLKLGEAAYSTDKKQLKIGNGTMQWTSLPYINILPTDKGIANGLATLDSSAKIPLTQIPAEVVLNNSLTTSLADYLEQGTFYSLLGVANGLATLDSDGYVPDSEISPTIARDSEITSAIVAEVASRNSAISTHAAVTTNVHGIADTSTLVIQSGLTSAISTHNSATTSVHGIANTANLATKNYVDVAVANLVNSAPTTLDTLKEIATALGNDANFSTTITTALGNKAPIASPTFTGTVTIPTGAVITGYLKTADADTTYLKIADASTTYLTQSNASSTYATITDLNLKAPLASPTFTGTVTLPNSTVTNAMLANSSITINGSSVSLGGSVSITGLPSQTSNSGKYLTTDGTNASWATLSTANYGNGTDTGNANKVFYNSTGTLPTGTANGDIYIQF